jgi:hypothetical protein
VSAIRNTDPQDVVIKAGEPISVHHVTTASVADLIARGGRIIPRNKNVMLFGNTDGGYFAFEGDRVSNRYYREQKRNESPATVSATITPRKPLVVRDFIEAGGGMEQDMRQPTRQRLAERIARILPADVRQQFEQMMAPLLRNVERAQIEYLRFQQRQSRLPRAEADAQFGETFRANGQASDAYANGVLAALKRLGYDALAIVTPRGQDPSDDIVGGSQVLALNPSIVQVHGIRPDR